MSIDSPPPEAGAKYYRRSSGFKLAMAAALAGIAGVLLHFWGPAPRPTPSGPGPSLAQMCAAAGAGCIWSAFLLNFLWGLTSRGRYFVTCFSAILIALPVAMAMPPDLGLAAAAAVTLGGVALFFLEFGLTIETGARNSLGESRKYAHRPTQDHDLCRFRPLC
jgi:hypothetical protein